MDKVTKKIFSIALIAIILLSILMIAAPVMAEEGMDVEACAKASSDTITLKSIGGLDTTASFSVPVSGTKVANSDNDRYESAGKWRNSYYPDKCIELQFQKLPAGTSVGDVKLKFEWQQDGEINKARLWVYGKKHSGYPIGDIYGLHVPPSYTDECEIISLDDIDTIEKVNNLKVWFQAKGGGKTKIDCVAIEIDSDGPEPTATPTSPIPTPTPTPPIQTPPIQTPTPTPPTPTPPIQTPPIQTPPIQTPPIQTPTPTYPGPTIPTSPIPTPTELPEPTEIPEFPLILIPVIAIIGLMFILAKK